MKSLPILAAAALLVFTALARAADTAPATAPTPGPKNDAGLTATLISNKESYTLTPGQIGKQFRDQLDQIKNARGRLPAPPAVDMTLRITNTSDKDVTISTGGDDSQIMLKLEGNGAVNMENQVAMTMEFRTGTKATIAPGQSKDIKISSLASGMRGITQHAYWTDAGDHTLTATLTYGTTDEKQAKITSAATKIKVEAPQ